MNEGSPKKLSVACYGGAINFGHFQLEVTDNYEGAWLTVIGYNGDASSLILGLKELFAIKECIDETIRFMSEDDTDNSSCEE
jgi:hypothetical protein